MGDQQRAREFLAHEYRKEGLYGQVDHTYGAASRAAIAAITAALRTAPEVARLIALMEQWEQRAANALPADAMLINKHIRELSSVLRGDDLLDQQQTVLVAPDSSKVIAPPALGAHEVHPEAVDVGLDLGKAGECLVAADALEHTPGVRQNYDGSATELEGFVMVPVEATDQQVDAGIKQVQAVLDALGPDASAETLALVAYDGMLAARPQGGKDV